LGRGHKTASGADYPGLFQRYPFTRKSLLVDITDALASAFVLVTAASAQQMFRAGGTGGTSLPGGSSHAGSG